MKVKHHTDGHDEKHTSEFMGIGRGVKIVRIHKVVAVEHCFWDNLVPARQS